MKKAIKTGLGSIVNQLNTKSQIGLAQAFADRAKNKREQIENSLLTKINAAHALATEARKKAEILDDFEKGQLEDALVKLMQTQGMQKLLDGICIKLADGNSYSVSTVLATIADFAVPEKEERRTSASGETTGFKYTLTNGVEVLTDLTNSENDDGSLITYTESTENWGGVAASKEYVIKVITNQVDNDGVSESFNTYEEQSVTHWLFDLSSELAACGAASTDVDLNDDGQIGSDGMSPDNGLASDAGDSGSSDSTSNSGDGAVL
jgi:hypothetical protein